MCNLLSTPRRHYAFSDLSSRSIGVWMIAWAASRYSLPHPKWAPCIDEAILHEDNRQEGEKELVFPRDGPSPRVELPYAYLMT